LIVDLNTLISADVAEEAETLKVRWAENWLTLNAIDKDIEYLTGQIDKVRSEIKRDLSALN